MIEVQQIPWDLIESNTWNPNRMTEVQYAAELGSLRRFGFVAPVLLRPHPDDHGRYQVVDGAHRVRGVQEIATSDDGLDGAHPDLVEHIRQRTLPAVVLNLSDIAARELTVVLNETRGSADPVLFGVLLNELAELGANLDDLTGVLPFTEAELTDLMKLPDFDWDTIETGGLSAAPDEPDGLSGGHPEQHGRVYAIVDDDAWYAWGGYVAQLRRDGIVSALDHGTANGQALVHLLHTAGITRASEHP